MNWLGWSTLAFLGQQLVHITQHLLHVQVGVFVLRQADGCFQKREVLVTLHQAGKVLQR